jgi:hypothetical protein
MTVGPTEKDTRDELAANNAPPDNPQLVSWSTDTDPYWSNLKATDPAAFQNNIRRLFFGDQQTPSESAKRQKPTAKTRNGTRGAEWDGDGGNLGGLCGGDRQIQNAVISDQWSVISDPFGRRANGKGSRLQAPGFGRRRAPLACARGSGCSGPRRSRHALNYYRPDSRCGDKIFL